MTDGKKEFNGIVLPLKFKNGEKNNCVGAVMGISQRELGLGPSDIVVNYAIPTNPKLSKAGMFWLEGCPETGPYSMTACSYWLLPYFSNLVDTGKTAVRIKPSRDSDGTWHTYDHIFWNNGSVVSAGHQYSFGTETSLHTFRNPTGLMSAREEWGRGHYDLKFSMNLGELNDNTKELLNKFPEVRLEVPRRELSIESRDAGWDAMVCLVKGIA